MITAPLFLHMEESGGCWLYEPREHHKDMECHRACSQERKTVTRQQKSNGLTSKGSKCIKVI